MRNSKGILKIYEDTFRVNIYTTKHFRMIGLIDVDIEYFYSVEKVTLAFYSSSGTNNGKIKGLWYPIVGIKTIDGEFTEFTPYLNFVLSNTTIDGFANKGWLAKSLFFASRRPYYYKTLGFSNGRYYDSLFYIGQTLKDLIERNKFYSMTSLKPKTLNEILTSEDIYIGNRCTQRENFERVIQDIFEEH
jgi:hypothetical protein